MTEQADTSDRNYLLAILYSRLKREEDALKMYVKSCDQDASKIWRGRLSSHFRALAEASNSTGSVLNAKATAKKI